MPSSRRCLAKPALAETSKPPAQKIVQFGSADKRKSKRQPMKVKRTAATVLGVKVDQLQSLKGGHKVQGKENKRSMRAAQLKKMR
ncbi:unnamed protein product [Chrysoparadoxa australica]